jgi:parvulin-like peptidyl-prolyl isomerase
MSVVLTVGDRQVRDDELYPLLCQYQLLPQLAREILIDQAIANVELTPEEKQQALVLFYQQMQVTNEEQRQALVKQSGMTLEEFENFILRTNRLEKFKHKTWDDQLEGHFLNSKDKLDQVIYSLIRNQDSGIIQELYFRIQEGEGEFSTLARQYSQGPEAQNGGLIGPVELNVPHPQMVQLLKSTPAGKLCLPTQIGDWWILLRLEKYISSQLDESIRQRLRNDLFQTWLNQQIQTKIEFAAVPTPTEQVMAATAMVGAED